jgi:hypothetical protein
MLAGLVEVFGIDLHAAHAVAELVSNFGLFVAADGAAKKAADGHGRFAGLAPLLMKRAEDVLMIVQLGAADLPARDGEEVGQAVERLYGEYSSGLVRHHEPLMSNSNPRMAGLSQSAAVQAA